MFFELGLFFNKIIFFFAFRLCSTTKEEYYPLFLQKAELDANYY
jgi:hypothetical protein